MSHVIKEKSSQSRRIHSAALRDEKNVACLIRGTK
jgi:hypothetical protein